MEEMDLKDVNATICRVCMQCVFEELPLFEEHDNCKISVKINALTNVCVREGDGLPDRICPTCLLELESAFKFKLKCENTNKLLQYFKKNLTQTPVKCFDYVGDPIKMENSDDEDGDEAPLLGDVSTQSESFDDVADSNRKEYLLDKYSDEAPQLGHVSTQSNSLDDVADSSKKEYLDNEDGDEELPLGDISTQSESFDDVADSNIKEYLDDEDCDEVPHVGDILTQSNSFDDVADSNRIENLDNEHSDEAPPVGDVSKQYDSFNNVADSNKKEYLDNFNSDQDDDNVDQIMIAEFSQHNEETDTDMQPHVETPAPSKAIDFKFECHDCGESFISKCKLRMHWKNVHLLEHLVCPKCKRQFKQYKPYNSHMKQICIDTSQVHVEGEGRNRVFHCKECSYHSQSLITMVSHSVVHTGARPFECDICHKTFKQKSSIRTHKETFHKLYKSGGACPTCGKYIQGKNRLANHIDRHTIASCKICNKKMLKRSLDNHMKRHTGIKEFVCELCSFAFYTSTELYKHKKSVHAPKLISDRRIKCNICNYTCKTNQTLAGHKKKHTDTNTCCHICGHFFDNEKQLALHMPKHIDRKYQCPICEKAFWTSNNLYGHIRRVHNKVKRWHLNTLSASV